MTWVGLVLAGGLGAWLRFRVDTAIRTRHRGPVPVGTLVINITGSFLLGMLTGYVIAHPAAAGWRPVLGTGLLGGFTTFSTAAVELVNLREAGRSRSAVVLGVGMLLGSLVAGAVGLLLGGLM